MPKKILLFADGTGNEGGLFPDESRTNVYKLFRATRTGPDSGINPTEQIAFYERGIGTLAPSKQQSWWQRRRDTIEQAVGKGLEQKISECFAAIIDVWEPGDRIYLFGFSRGAYTVRCLAHVLELCGIPTRNGPSDPLNYSPASLKKVARAAVRILYQFGLAKKISNRRADQLLAFRERHASQLGIEIGALPYFVGVWETVAAIGLARFFPERYDLHFPKDIPFARHAMAIDEYRADFKRVPWGGSGTVSTDDIEGVPRFRQVWFAGDHSDIGGSYPENESRLSDVALKWMVDVVANELPAAGRIAVNRQMLNYFPSAAGMMHDECMVGMAGGLVPWKQAVRPVPHEAELHPSVIERLAMKQVRNFISVAPYRPASLKDHPKARQFYSVTAAR